MPLAGYCLKKPLSEGLFLRLEFPMLRTLFHTLLGKTRRKRHLVRPVHQFDELMLSDLLNDGAEDHRAGLLKSAELKYRAALERNPDDAAAMHLMGTLLLQRRDYDGAEKFVRESLARVPDSPHVLNSLGTVLSATGRHSEARQCLERALQHAPGEYKPFANLLFLMNFIPGVPRSEIFDLHRKWAGLHGTHSPEQPFARKLPDSNVLTSGDRRLRVGYVSADFCAHPVGRIMCGVLRNHDRAMVHVTCYDNGSAHDEIWHQCEASADVWRDISGQRDDSLAELIRNDGIHLLVDLSGHTRKNRLGAFAYRPAPVQLTWLGYLNTTGMQSIDWRLTDSVMDPMPYALRWHAENILYLPDCIWPCQPIPELQVSSPPFRRTGRITFGSVNTFRKLNSAVFVVWARILKANPDAQLAIYGVPEGVTVDRLFDEFDSLGVESARLQFMKQLEYKRYLGIFSEIDIALDPFPYSGGETTWESLWMGVPVVALPGDGGFSRTSASLLTAAGCSDWIAGTADDYVRIATNLASDKDRLAAIRADLRAKLLRSPLCDSVRFTRNLEQAFRTAWCASGILPSDLQQSGVSC